MARLAILMILLILFASYSGLVYTAGTSDGVRLDPREKVLVNQGKILFQEYNCISCHQIYGLGGYLGPELTTAWSDKTRGEAYMRALLKSGGGRMPNFQLKTEEINSIIAYLRYVDSTATPVKHLYR